MHLDKNTTGFFLKASIVALPYGRAPHIHSAVITHLSFKLCLLGKNSCSVVIRKLEAKNCVGVEDKSTKSFLLFTSVMSMPDECKTTLHQQIRLSEGDIL